MSAKNRKLVSTIDAVVGYLPPEIVNIVVDYSERIHTWSDFENVRATTNDDGTTDIYGNDAGPQLNNAMSRLLVSAETFATGRTRWYVDYRRTMRNDLTKWIAVGFTTTATENRVFGYDSSSCLLYLEDRGAISIVDGSRYRPVAKMEPTTTQIRVDFQAFPATGNVTAAVHQSLADGDWRSSYPVVLNNEPIAGLLACRPAILIAGMNSAVFRSEPT